MNTVMKVNLSDITSLLPPFSFRGTLPASEEGTVAVVQMKNIGQNGAIDWKSVVKIPYESRYEKYFLQTGDVLFLGRGERNAASVIGCDCNQTLTATYFTTMRLVDRWVLPEFLAVFLNHPATQAKLKQKASGTTINLIPTSELAQLTVNIPPLEIQRQIVEINKLQCRAENIEAKIQMKRRALIEKTVERMLQ